MSRWTAPVAAAVAAVVVAAAVASSAAAGTARQPGPHPVLDHIIVTAELGRSQAERVAVRSVRLRPGYYRVTVMGGPGDVRATLYDGPATPPHAYAPLPRGCWSSAWHDPHDGVHSAGGGSVGIVAVGEGMPCRAGQGEVEMRGRAWAHVRVVFERLARLD